MAENAGYQGQLERLRANLGKAIFGKPECLDLLLTALFAGGSVLMEDIPGVGKTTLAKALARSVKAEFSRIQFTPDLLPADILGSSVYSPADGSFTFRRGPVFGNVVLADEINRASPRTQSALLEAMSELQATIEGTRYPLPSPFLVVATQNPIEFHGTYPLPEAQLDRFLVLLRLGYPSPDVEVSILYSQIEGHPLERLEPVLACEEVSKIQQAVRRIHVDEDVSRYMVEIVGRTREDDRLKLGVSPRGSLMLFRASQAAAFLADRDFVLPDDVQRLAPAVLAHRVMLTSKAKYSGVSKEAVIMDILEHAAVPK
ncbi:MAG TPA: MoxR family ATPase [Candidatus Hydrogenedentes bacterium]|nr:MoxR family ATPase [Candidatus Hydrogenedentota bacterium]